MTIKQYLKFKKEELQENQTFILIGSALGSTIIGLTTITKTIFGLPLLLYPLTIFTYYIIKLEKETYEDWKLWEEESEKIETKK